MKKQPGIDGDKLAKVIEAARSVYEQLGELLAEVEAELAGKPTINAKMKRIESTFGELWTARYRSKYVWNYARDRAAMKRLLHQLESVEEIEKRAGRYLKNSDQFFATARHSFGLFASTIVQHVEAADIAEDFELGESAPADCRHVPACRSDREHTKKRASEMAAF